MEKNPELRTKVAGPGSSTSRRYLGSYLDLARVARMCELALLGGKWENKIDCLFQRVRCWRWYEEYDHVGVWEVIDRVDE